MTLPSSPRFWSATALILGAVFGWWVITAILPVVVLEVRYQTLQLLEATFQTSDIRRVFIPNFSGALDLHAQSQHETYGITIPRLHLDEPVVFNVDPNDQTAYTAALKKGIAHASGTAFPDQPGLGYYFAHSSHPDFRLQYNAIFYLLGKMQPGDDIFIWHENQKFSYQVTQIKETDPAEVNFLTDDYPAETIVLQTCWPPGTTQRRLLVFAERVVE